MKNFIMITDLFIKWNVFNKKLTEHVNNISIKLIILKVEIVLVYWFFITVNFIAELIKEENRKQTIIKKRN
jgi:hypothetical protein